MNRKSFLKNGFYFSGGLWLSQLGFAQKAMAQAISAPAATGQQPKFFVQVILEGGWHTSLSVDPWILPKRLDEKDAFIEYLDSDVIRQGDISMGPAMASMKDFAPNMNVINGIFLSTNDNGHQAAQIYTTSGKGNGEAGSFAAELSLNEPESVLGVIATQPAYSGTKSVDTTMLYELSALQTSTGLDSDFQNPSSPIFKAIMAKQSNQTKITAFLNEITQLKNNKIEVKDRHYLAAAFKADLAFSSSYTPGSQDGSLDTHSNHPITHLRAQKSMWDQVAELLNAFKLIEYKAGTSLFDVTTFFITSDFSRTPALDSSKGTNHNPLNNSAIIIGPGFKGNKTFGASRVVPGAESANGKSYLIAQMVDLKTGEVLKTKKDAEARGALIKPETVIATLAEGMKIQRNIFSPISVDEPAITQLLK